MLCKKCVECGFDVGEAQVGGCVVQCVYMYMFVLYYVMLCCVCCV